MRSFCKLDGGNTKIKYNNLDPSQIKLFNAISPYTLQSSMHLCKKYRGGQLDRVGWT